MEKATSQMRFMGGFPILIPNKTYQQSPWHYISYNNVDRHIYGDKTTAIVISCTYGKNHKYGSRFLILKGNHLEQLFGKTFVECMEYFSKNIHLKAPYSDDVVDILNFKPMC